MDGSEYTLDERLEQCIDIIGEMAKQHRGPKMSIPVQPTDEDVILIDTLRDAIERYRLHRKMINRLESVVDSYQERYNSGAVNDEQ